ncbi:MAG: polymer-forming cytoskeletal protein, partial [Nitrospinota bacterium]
MLGRNSSQRQAGSDRPDNGSPGVSTTLLTIVGDQAKLEGKFDITGSIQIEWEISGQLKVSGKLVIGERGIVHADVETVDAIIQGQYEGNM